MRLKYFFFPIVLVISASIFIGYIWPGISDIRKINEEAKGYNETLKSIEEKKSAIERISTQIINNSDAETFIKSYLPEKKAEERIISGLNYLATDSNVSLINVSMKNVEQSASSSSKNTAEKISDASKAAKSSTIPNASKSGGVPAVALSTKLTEATISISGDYQRIRIFIDGVQKMPLFNSIKSLHISKQENLGPDPDAQPITSLQANVVISFGYLEPIKIDDQKIANFKAELDEAAVTTLKSYVSQKTPAMINDNGSNKGKADPFQP